MWPLLLLPDGRTWQQWHTHTHMATKQKKAARDQSHKIQGNRGSFTPDAAARKTHVFAPFLGLCSLSWRRGELRMILPRHFASTIITPLSAFSAAFLFHLVVLPLIPGLLLLCRLLAVPSLSPRGKQLNPGPGERNRWWRGEGSV